MIGDAGFCPSTVGEMIQFDEAAYFSIFRLEKNHPTSKPWMAIWKGSHNPIFRGL